MTRRFLLTFAMAAGMAAAQSGEVSILPVPEYTPFEKAKAYLNLTAAQITSLQANMESKGRAERVIWDQVEQKQRALNELLQAGSNDALRIGQLMVELNQLQKQLPLPDAQYIQTAVGVLTQEQKAKLPALENALQLAPAGYEASYLLLIRNPQGGQIRPALYQVGLADAASRSARP